MKIRWFIFRFNLSALLMNISLWIMPKSEYKSELLRRLWELRVDTEMAFDNKENENE